MRSQVISNKKIRHLYALGYESAKIDDHLVLYESRDGRSITDSPLAIFMKLAVDPQYNYLKHVWVINEHSKVLLQSIPENLRSSVELVLRNSKRYVECLLQAKYLINNSTFPSFFSKRQDQIYINTWHGTPLKSMGYDIPGDPSHSQNVVRNLLMTDYLLTPNAHTTEVFSESYRLKGLYPGMILEGGYPRIDLTIGTHRDVLVGELLTEGVKIDPQLPNILYMPTWRGDSVSSPKNNIEQTIQEVLHLSDFFQGRYNVLLKVHPYVFNQVNQRSELRGVLINDRHDANRILSMTDVLITDFSSVFFDYLVTEKPIIFYAWDQDLYENERGMYFDMSELPGPILSTIMEVEDTIEKIKEVTDVYQEKYLAMKDKMTPYDDGKVTERVVERIFGTRKVDSQKMKELSLRQPERKKILIYPGGMMNNGITTSFLNLVNTIDHQKYDITVFTQAPNGQTLNNIMKIPKQVRIIFKPGAPIFTKREELRNKEIQQNKQVKEYPEAAYKRESRRLFSGIIFDVVIDFSGYSFYWAKFFAFSSSPKKLIFQHNDLWEDSHKEVAGQQPHLKNMQPMFCSYHLFDEIVNVSESLMQINEQKLSKYIGTTRMSYVTNLLDLKKLFTPEEISSDGNVLEFEVVNSHFLVSTPMTVRIGKSLQDVLTDQTETYELKERDQIISVAKYQEEQASFHKVLINHIYVGWLAEENLLGLESSSIFSEKEVHLVASIRRKENCLIYSGIPGSDSEVFVRSYLKYLSKRYVWVTKQCETTRGKYYFIKDGKTPLGWVEEKALANWHEISPLSLMQGYFKLKNRKHLLTVMDRLDQEKYKVAFDDEKLLVIYSEPQGLVGSYIRSNGYLPQPFKTYHSIAQAVVKNVQWDLLAENEKILGWIKRKGHILLKQADVGEKRQKDPVLNWVKAQMAPTDVNYVMMGRFSPEKNHSGLIEAFSNICKNIPEAKLYLLGEGVLFSAIEKEVVSMDLAERVVFLGQVDNPFPILRLMDVFILPSLYEGQPMVLLESLALGLKVVATNIPQNAYVLGEGSTYGLLTEGTDAESLKQGMLNILNPNLVFEVFDYVAYNEAALQRFYTVIG
ncbi:CDP-glycerol glycerophosphotransferase family protein [Enterococcus sp. BWB1-3]|uniref:CDP-glycerol glycerophosphotransferase family protein n=1 Tax=Enterococcus sp. BWB1-3 TaxID=2787713 RepID=UPI0019225915|nr:CDP-glycerol glycerophosphotransferase family protein [Enterococcus sp. BWB1-3]